MQLHAHTSLMQRAMLPPQSKKLPAKPLLAFWVYFFSLSFSILACSSAGRSVKNLQKDIRILQTTDRMTAELLLLCSRLKHSNARQKTPTLTPALTLPQYKGPAQIRHLAGRPGPVLVCALNEPRHVTWQALWAKTPRKEKCFRARRPRAR